jgi:two-component system sensor histidine kinase RegB
MISSSIAQWRRRQMVLRGVLVFILALLAVIAGLHGSNLPGHSYAPYWLAALWLPSTWYWPTRSLSKPYLPRLLTVELSADSLLFLGLMYSLGGSANPLTFYLLVPVLISALSLPLASSSAITALNIAGYGIALYWHQVPDQHSGLHAMTHELNALHGQGMWLAFSLVAVVLTVLGQSLQRARQLEHAQQATELSLALQRERMYQLAGGLADRAHELNTPLSTLLLLLDEMNELSVNEATILPLVQQSQALGERLADILRSDINASREDGAQRLSTLHAELRQSLRLLAPTLNITLAEKHDPLLSPASAWHRILLNLGYNASDAGANILHIECQQDSDKLIIQVSDDGPRKNGNVRQGLGVGIALIETTLASMQGTIEYRFEARWTQALITVPYEQPNKMANAAANEKPSHSAEHEAEK